VSFPLPEIEKRTYEIAFAHGELIRVEFPATWKVTYGPVIGAAGKPAYGDSHNTLRVWETDKLQRALWAGVTGFRDVTSITVMVKAVRAFGSDTWRPDDGTYTGAKAQTVEKAWKPVEEISYEPDEETSEDVVPF
jgi:hypothetical protein